ncbi:AlkZ family DNA glycosylase [Dactylosporangium roseum]|uniref:AlkZ family DNA glycosylase n=1 Tax=Dactylosporangium roseum TaxID=47989 RepID=A0ABY5ZAL4_9ACTN|nr:winged helix DNA-binding domain-containing protein [Dactylosporangium roseum]UWZ39130.1 AlkZ family DNA glycosylase [Dactylosporangium roseum]
MTRQFTEDEIRLTRARAQRLTGDRAKDVADVVRDLVGTQSQDIRAARMALRPRTTTGVDAAAVDRACNEDRSVVRIWAMRSTLHMVAAEDVRWIVGLLGPIFAAADKRRRSQLGLDDDMLRSAVPKLERIVAAEGPLTRADLVRRLDAKGVRVDPKSQAPAHLIGYAAMTGIICRGPEVDKDEPTYVLIDDWAGKQTKLDGDAALAELTRRYVASRGPVTPQDFAKWSGLPAKQAKRGFELVADELEEVDAAGSAAWVTTGTTARTPGRKPAVQLLGHFDELLLGYASRELVLAPAFTKRIQVGGGFIQPAVLVDGRVLGAWKQQRDKDRLIVRVQPFEALPDAAAAALEAEAADIGRFLGVDAELQVGKPG